ncbi:MAG: diaminopimelate epimerase [Fluviicola sp.]
MQVKFFKYQGTGNDFVMLDNRDGRYDALSLDQIVSLCDRRFGVGADGLIKINSKTGFDFEVDYYNADGSKSFCGNGARCAVAFADFLGVTQSEVRFLAIDGEHDAVKKGGLVHLKMNDIDQVDLLDPDLTIFTGSPHYLRFCQNVRNEDIYAFGRSVRYSDWYKAEGINVNLIEQNDPKSFKIRTYERGVEDETLSCGTGVTAAAAAMAIENQLFGEYCFKAETMGGQLEVCLDHFESNKFRNVWLIGPAVQVFEGVYKW